jgi:hypothetical protein
MTMKTLTLCLTAALAFTLVGCNESQLTQRPATSQCGGFFGDNTNAHKSPMGDPATYCDAEVLWWSYASETQTLALADNRMMLNCCGDHSIDVALENGTYVVTETDAPQASAGGARCGCMCVFDFTTEVEPVPAGTIQLRVVRNVTDSEVGPETIWEGALDLTAGSGNVTLDASGVDMWCTPPAV